MRFEKAAPRRFDLVVGADGLHSNVRRLVFGDECRFSAFIGAYLGVLTGASWNVPATPLKIANNIQKVGQSPFSRAQPVGA
ncbi:MAG: hypothetical protein WCD21_22850 [Streptomyces sp.]